MVEPSQCWHLIIQLMKQDYSILRDGQRLIWKTLQNTTNEPNWKLNTKLKAHILVIEPSIFTTEDVLKESVVNLNTWFVSNYASFKMAYDIELWPSSFIASTRVAFSMYDVDMHRLYAHLLANTSTVQTLDNLT